MWDFKPPNPFLHGQAQAQTDRAVLGSPFLALLLHGAPGGSGASPPPTAPTASAREWMDRGWTGDGQRGGQGMDGGWTEGG